MTAIKDPMAFLPPPQAPPPECPRCARNELTEEMMRTVGVVYRRCGVCGHVWVVRLSAPAPEPTEPAPAD